MNLNRGHSFVLVTIDAAEHCIWFEVFYCAQSLALSFYIKLKTSDSPEEIT
jgi:hypothetical protein